MFTQYLSNNVKPNTQKYQQILYQISFIYCGYYICMRKCICVFMLSIFEKGQNKNYNFQHFTLYLSFCHIMFVGYRNSVEKLKKKRNSICHKKYLIKAKEFKTKENGYILKLNLKKNREKTKKNFKFYKIDSIQDTTTCHVPHIDEYPVITLKDVGC